MFSTTQTTDVSREASEQIRVLHFVLQGNHGIAEGFHTLRILTQQVQHQTHSRFPADTGKFGKLSYRFFQ